MPHVRIATLVLSAFLGLLSLATAAQPPKTVTLLLSNLWTTATPPGADTVHA